MRISASLARSDRASRASQPNTRSTARYANRSDTSAEAARQRAIAQPDTELVLPCPEVKHQVNNSDAVSGTHSAARSATKLDITEQEIYDYLSRIAFGSEKLDDVFPEEAIVPIPLYATANLLLTFSPGEKHWWEYLDQVWDAAETAERTSLTVLPALMLRARKQPTQAPESWVPPCGDRHADGALEAMSSSDDATLVECTAASAEARSAVALIRGTQHSQPAGRLGCNSRGDRP